MPSLNVLLKHVQMKYPELDGFSIGTYYKEFRNKSADSPFTIRGAPLEGPMYDDDNFNRNMIPRDYIVEINEKMKHADNVVKVGLLAKALSYIKLREEIENNTHGLSLLKAVLSSYKDPTFEDALKDAEGRGFGRPLVSADKYIKQFEWIPVTA